jgi:hypothetical protein
LEFYLKWTGNFPDVIDCINPYLDPLNPQSDYAPVFLALFKEYVMQDKAYLQRIKQHYSLFKAELKRKAHPFMLVKPSQPKPKSKRRRHK